MVQFLRKRFGQLFHRQFTPASSDKEEANLEQFFTDNDYALHVFNDSIGTSSLSRHLLIIHGIGSVGKSTLLIMYHLTCQKRRIAIGLVRGEEVKSSVDVLRSWASDLSTEEITLPTFQNTLNQYRTLEGKVETSVREMSRAARVGKGAAGSAVRAVTSLIPIPIVNSLAGDLGASVVEAITNNLHSSFSRADLELYLDPTERLTNDFLHDLSRAAPSKRIVLMIDTYEQMTTLDDWVRNLAKKLPENILLVIAGREIPNWNRAWPEWRGKANILELKEMTSDDLRTLVHRYYTYIGGEGEPDAHQVEAIVQLARGLPMIATTAVDSWVHDHIEDFQSLQSLVVLDLVDRFLEGTSAEMRHAFEVAAVLRYFNIEILAALLSKGDADDLYAKLRQRRSFIHQRSQGLAVQDSMREFMNKALYLNKPERFHALHQQAALFYEAKLEHARGEERERFMLERVYHRLLADEVSGIQLFQQTAEELVHYRFFVQLRALLKDMETYKLELHEETSLLWLKYYNARLALLEEKWEEAEYLYEEIEKARPEPKLYAYTLCDHGEILSILEWRKKEGSPQKAVELIQRAFGLIVPDRKLVSGHKSLSIVYEFQGQMELAEHHLLEMLQFYQQQGDAIGAADVCFDLRWHYMLRGNWKRMLEVHKIGLENMAPYLDISPALKEKALRVNWGHIWVGRYNEFVNNFRIIVEDVLPQLADSNRKSHDLCFLAYGEGMRKTFDEAQGHFNEAFALLREQGLENRKDFQGPYRGFWGAIYTKQGSFDKAEQYLREALAIKQEVQDALGIPELLMWLGEIYEIRKIWDKAENFYRQCMEDYRVGRPYFDCTALTGWVRVSYSLSQYDCIPLLFNQAEALAQQYEYNDHLASLYLTQGHLAWEDQHIDEKQRFDAALRFYQRALIHALRYNRFLLDEVLSGKVPTTLQSLIPHCLDKGEEGLQMLRSIRDWWQSGTNDTGTPRLDTISLISEGMQLLDAEVKARQLEPGTAQQTVLEQLQGF
jgi:tetratricopeptide (TPR) repeat protein